MYDKIITNIGGGYSAQTGVFTCPLDGEYVFTWSTYSGYTTDGCFTYIYRNGQSSMVVNSYEKGSVEEAASNTVIFHLQMGDTVWIQTAVCEYNFGYPYTGFSGWKL